MKKEFVRNPYNYDSDELSDATGLKCEDESLTEQDHLEETDINYIADRFMKTGMAPQVLNMPSYGEFAGVFDFQSAMNLINEAKQEFMSLPAKLRSRFNNDPQELITFLENDENREEAIRLGLIEKTAILEPLSTQSEVQHGRESGSTTQGNKEEGARQDGTETTPRKGKAAEKS